MAHPFFFFIIPLSQFFKCLCTVAASSFVIIYKHLLRPVLMKNMLKYAKQNLIVSDMSYIMHMNKNVSVKI